MGDDSESRLIEVEKKILGALQSFTAILLLPYFEWTSQMESDHNELCDAIIVLEQQVYKDVESSILQWKKQEMDQTIKKIICLKSIKIMVNGLLVYLIKYKRHLELYKSFLFPISQCPQENHQQPEPGVLSWLPEVDTLITNVVKKFAFIVKDQPPEVLKDVVNWKKIPSVESLLEEEIDVGDGVKIQTSMGEVEAKVLWEYQIQQESFESLESVIKLVNNKATFENDNSGRRFATFPKIKAEAAVEAEAKPKTKSKSKPKPIIRMTEDHIKGHKAHFGYAPSSVATQIAYMVFVTAELTLTVDRDEPVKIPCRAVSFPIATSKHSYQDYDGDGCVMCYRRFGEIQTDGWVKLQRDSKMPIVDVIEMMSTRFHSLLDVGLSDEGHIKCLMQMAAEIKGVKDGGMTLDQFCVVKLKKAKCSFWTWVCGALMAMVNEKTMLGKIWEIESLRKGFGFLSSETAKELLKDAEPGTFIIRFPHSAKWSVSIVIRMPGKNKFEEVQTPLSNAKDTNILEHANGIPIICKILYPNIPKTDRIFTDNIQSEVAAGCGGKYKNLWTLLSTVMTLRDESEGRGMISEEGSRNQLPGPSDISTDQNNVLPNNDVENDEGSSQNVQVAPIVPSHQGYCIHPQPMTCAPPMNGIINPRVPMEEAEIPTYPSYLANNEVQNNAWSTQNVQVAPIVPLHEGHYIHPEPAVPSALFLDGAQEYDPAPMEVEYGNPMTDSCSQHQSFTQLREPNYSIASYSGFQESRYAQQSWQQHPPSTNHEHSCCSQHSPVYHSVDTDGGFHGRMFPNSGPQPTVLHRPPPTPMTLTLEEIAEQIAEAEQNFKGHYTLFK